MHITVSIITSGEDVVATANDFTFKVRSSSVGSIASYSIAYPGRSISAFSNPGIDFTIAV